MARFGGWLTVSNVVSPLLVYADRFLIGSLLSAAAVTFYATPADVVTRLSLIPLALVPVIFPALAPSSLVDSARTARLLRSATSLVVLFMLPLAVFAFALASDLLEIWLDTRFAEQSTRVVQLIVIGAFLNGVAQAPLALVQGSGRPDLGAKLQLLELPVYLPVAWLFIDAYGIEGAATAWLIRVAFDTLALFLLASYVTGGEPVLSIRAAAFALSGLALAILMASLSIEQPASTVLGIGSSVAIALIAWRHMLDARERHVLLSILPFSSAKGTASAG
jgi:O-antigen/teichoic acid export membrane protein